MEQVQVIKKDHNYALPYSQETIQLLQEMGMKYNLQKRKKNLKKLWKISRIHLQLHAENIPFKRVPWSY